MPKVKFATKLEATVLKELRAHAKVSKVPIAEIVSQAVAEHLRMVQVRPAFRDAADQVMAEHSELLQRLAK